MSDHRLTDVPPLDSDSVPAMRAASLRPLCEECVGSGGWFRYEPALAPAPGQLYLSCVQCRGSGRIAAS
jgi:hypothetical protein